jgi:hypothetical protein
LGAYTLLPFSEPFKRILALGVYNPAQGSPLPSLGGEDFMSQITFSLVAGIFFLLIAVMHVLRLGLKLEVALNGRPVPMWVNWLALVIAGFLAFEGLKLGGRS